MRHKNGNCLPCGGFCTAVSNEICEALRNAYEHGLKNGFNVKEFANKELKKRFGIK